ncbi:glycosyltransferase [Planococcus sp. MERTA32b]|nr:glycosyltransferase [Planococcus sp. MER TA 32b]
MSRKNILVNATSLASGGGLTVLNQFMADLSKEYEGKETIFYVFVPDTYKEHHPQEHIHCHKNKDNPFYRNRNYWNLRGLKKWVKHEDIEVDELFSLQNYYPFGFNSRKIFKRLYLHQPIPFFDYKWRFFRNEERKLWFYQNIYYQLIKSSVRKSGQVIVQTNWFKRQIIKKTGIDEELVLVDKPAFNHIDPGHYSKIEGLKGSKRLFFPADDYAYKNHEILFKAMNILVNGPRQRKDIVLYFTLDKNNVMARRYMKEYKVEENIILTGKLSYEKVMCYYLTVDVLLFPSKVETFGMPLLESKAFGLPIIASDLDLYREVIGETEQTVAYCTYDDEQQWAQTIEYLIDQG